MIRRKFIKSIFRGLGLLLIPGLVRSSNERRPNVLLIMTDDQGFGDISSHGNDQIDTPVMDQLAREGVRFDRFFVSPVCSPTRASLLTGRYHLRTGTTWVTRNREAMRTEEVTIAEVLKRGGYTTGCFGKWHNGAHYPEHPNAQGFDEFFGFCGGVIKNYFDTELEHNEKAVKTKGYIADVLTDKAIEFMNKNSQKPFFCYLPYNTPHTPCQVPDQYFDKYKNRGLDDRTACIYGMIENIDDNLKRILNALKKLKIEKDTIVIFMSDNGPAGERYNAGMRGWKATMDEGGVRVPMFIRWTGHFEPGKVIKENAAHIDLLPTITALCGVSAGETLPLDGRNLKPLLEGSPEEWSDRILLTFPAFRDEVDRSSGAVRTQKWRAVKREGKWELYDMIEDSNQMKNVAEKYPRIMNNLKSEYEKTFEQIVKDGLKPLPIQIGHPGRPDVTLLGHEAVLVPQIDDGISYHWNPGWAGSWIANWTDVNSYPQWDIKIVQDGVYEITLFYVCAKENLGAHIQVEVDDQSIDAVVKESHNPDPISVPFRLENEKIKYMSKVWKPLTLGNLYLNKGDTLLTVKSLSIHGKKSVDLKAVELKKK